AALPAPGGDGRGVGHPRPRGAKVSASAHAAPARVTLRANVRVASPGGTVTLILENAEGGSVGFNLCFHTLEVQTREGWHTVDRSRICTLTLYTLAPGQVATRPVTLPRDLPPGL